MQINRQNAARYYYPQNDQGWNQLAIDCVGLANSGGGSIELSLQSDNNLDNLQQQITNQLSILTHDLTVVVTHLVSAISLPRISVVIAPTIASLSDGRFFILQNGQNNLLVGKQILKLFNAFSINQTKHELISLKQGLEESQIPLLILNKNQLIEMANKSFCELLGRSLTDVLHQPMKKFICAGSSQSSYSHTVIQLNGSNSGQCELSLAHRNLTEITVEFTITGIQFHQQDAEKFLVQIRDLRESHSTLNALKRLAFYDPISSLPNRALLKDRLGMALASSFRQKSFGALLFIDLDHFKQINDVHGHSHGDLVLKAYAQILMSTLREEDTLARLGGDEFVALLQGIGDDFNDAKSHAIQIAKKMLNTIKKPIEVSLLKHFVGASIGITLFPKALETADDLLREADTAMYAAKAAGRGRILCFEAEMYQAVSNRYLLESELRDALKQNQLEIYLQPQVTHDGEWCAAEALIRWNHPKNGLTGPDAFIYITEETGQIVAIGTWVLNQVCKLIAKSIKANKPIKIAANVSALQFREPDFVERVITILASTGALPELLTIELTESILLADASATATVMHQLAEVGVNFSIDDFGTGYSNLGYLHKLPLKEIKIDRSFIQDVCENPHDASLVEVLLSLANHLKLDVVAEGVETIQQAELLNKLACPKMQGYLFKYPVPAKDFMDLWLNPHSERR